MDPYPSLFPQAEPGRGTRPLTPKFPFCWFLIKAKSGNVITTGISKERRLFFHFNNFSNLHQSICYEWSEAGWEMEHKVPPTPHPQPIPMFADSVTINGTLLSDRFSRNPKIQTSANIWNNSAVNYCHKEEFYDRLDNIYLPLPSRTAHKTLYYPNE